MADPRITFNYISGYGSVDDVPAVADDPYEVLEAIQTIFDSVAVTLMSQNFEITDKTERSVSGFVTAKDTREADEIVNDAIKGFAHMNALDREGSPVAPRVPLYEVKVDRRDKNNTVLNIRITPV